MVGVGVGAPDVCAEPLIAVRVAVAIGKLVAWDAPDPLMEEDDGVLRPKAVGIVDSVVGVPPETVAGHTIINVV